jgi:hypothetical protein
MTKARAGSVAALLSTSARHEKAGIVCEGVDERARLDELRGGRHDFVGRREQQAVVFEERTAGRLRNRYELLRIGLERRGQGLRGGVGEFRRARFDDHQHGLTAIRERLVHGIFERRPLLVRLDETADVRVDLEVIDNVETAQNGEHERQRDDPHRMTH